MKSTLVIIGRAPVDKNARGKKDLKRPQHGLEIFSISSNGDDKPRKFLRESFKGDRNPRIHLYNIII